MLKFYFNQKVIIYSLIVVYINSIQRVNLKYYFINKFVKFDDN